MKTFKASDVKAQTSEKVFTRQVIKLAQLMGWKVVHFRPARLLDKDGAARWRTPVSGDGVGFVDLVCARNGVMIFAELKTDTGKVRPAQADWLAALAQVEAATAGQVKVRVYRPSMWAQIEKELGGAT